MRKSCRQATGVHGGATSQASLPLGPSHRPIGGGTFPTMTTLPPSAPDGPNPEALSLLQERFGYPGFRPGQWPLIEAVLRGRDALGVLPTGGGKSVCYQVPALLLTGITLVLSPLVSLMEDQARRGRAAGIPVEALHAQLGEEELRVLERRARSGELKLLLLAPERLESARFLSLLQELSVALVAVDEAHCISMWGHDFRPSYRKIGRLRETTSAPFMALTATATPRVRTEIEELLGLRAPVREVGSFDRPNLLWGVRGVQGEEERLSLMHRRLREFGAARLVYAATRRRTEGLRDALAGLGHRAEAYHAGLSATERGRVQSHFLTAEAPVVVATNAFGMGIDRGDVRLVLHDQLPGSLEAYYQEAGRAGRDGSKSLCLALHAPTDARVHRGFLDRTHPRPLHPGALWGLLRRGELGGRLARRRAGLTQLRGIERYAYTKGCRRRVLLGWFGEGELPEHCGGCDRCLGEGGVLERSAAG